MYTIDRLEGRAWAVVEWSGAGRAPETFNLPRAALPAGAREGDVVRIYSRVDAAATAGRRAAAAELARQVKAPW
jgi:hypothetical protein